MAVVIQGAAEGVTDAAVLRRLVRHAGAVPGDVFGLEGKPALLKNLRGYNQAAHYSPWLALVDLDQDGPCAPPARLQWLPETAALMCFRVVVRQVEAWLLADRERFASWFRVRLGTVPENPDDLENPKGVLVALAHGSRRRGVKKDMVPREGSGRSVGPAYTSRLIEFIEDRARGWRPGIAAGNSDSLRRYLACLDRLIASTPR